MAKKLSRKIFFRLFKCTARSPLFFSLSFMALLFMIYADGIVSKVAFHPLDLPSYEIFEMNGIQDTEEVIVPLLVSLNNDTSFKKQQKQEEIDDDLDRKEVVVPPTNFTREERIGWFRRRLTETEILEPSDLAKRFHPRLLEFFNHGCDIQLYTTWFEPSRSFGPRQRASLETLLKAHPKGCLVILSRTLDSRRGYAALKPLIDLGFRVLAITPDFSFLLKNTPAESWLEGMRNGDQDPGSVPFTLSLSNLLRIAVLYKYGGVYIDVDYVVVRDFYGLGNAIGSESEDSKTKKWKSLNNAVMIFEMGHPILSDFMEEFTWNFNGNKWGYNGPTLVSRVVERVGANPGYNLTILPSKAFYPVSFADIHRLVKKPLNESESRWVESKVSELSDGETYGVHLWNSEIEEGSVLGKLISSHCVVCRNLF